MTNSVFGSIDPYKLASRQQVLQGKFPITLMARATKLLAEDSGEIDYNITFAMDAENICVITGKIHGELTFCCQRCLQKYTQAISGEFVVSPVAHDDEAKTLPSLYEAVITQHGALDLLELIEDELILALPLVAMHDMQFCKAVPAMQDQNTEQNINPFKVLQDIVKK